MKAPTCQYCGKTEWHHLCGGQSQSEIGRRFEHARGGKRPSFNKLPSFITREVPRSVPHSRVKALEAEIEALQGEVRQLKRQLAEAHGATKTETETKTATINRGGRPKTGKAMTSAERLRRHRAKAKASKSGVQQFEG